MMVVEDNSGTVVSFPFEQHKVDALFYHIATHREHREEKPVVLRPHGTLGNLFDETEHFLPELLASAGYLSLTMNTLLANLGLFFGFGIFDAAVKQIDAGCQFLRQVGFKKVNVPVLLLRGEHDPLVEQWETEALTQLVQETARVNVSVRQISRAGHDCMENSEEMLKAVVQMMSAESARSYGNKKADRKRRPGRQRAAMNEDKAGGDG